MEEPIFTPKPSPWILIAIAAVILATLVFGLAHGMVRTGGIVVVIGMLLAVFGVWLGTRKRRNGP